MKVLNLATYHTRTGLVSMTISEWVNRGGKKSYSYTGKHGAGSTTDLEHIRDIIRSNFRHHRGIRLVQGKDLLIPV